MLNITILKLQPNKVSKLNNEYELMRQRPTVKISLFSFQDIITSTTGIIILVALILTFFLNAESVIGQSSKNENLEDRLEEIRSQIEATVQGIENLEELLAQWANVDAAELREQIAQLEQQLAGLEKEINNLGEEAQEAARLAALLANAQKKARELAMRIEMAQKQLADLKRKAKEAGAANILFPTLDPLLVNKKLLLVVLSLNKHELYEYNADGRVGLNLNSYTDLVNTLKSRNNPSSYQVVLFVRPNGIDDFEKLHGPALVGKPTSLNLMGYRSVGWDVLDQDAVLFGAEN